MNRENYIERSQYQTVNSPNRIINTRSPQSRQNGAVIYRNSNLVPSVHIEPQRSQIRQASNPSVSPTVSFGAAGSTIRSIKAITLKNSDTYEGQMNSRNQFHGQGKYTFSREKLQYIGNFQFGKQSGRGQLFKIISGSSSNLQKSSQYPGKILIYEGDWANGKKNGQGRYCYDQDQTHFYSGPWLNDERHGMKGTYKSPIYEYTGEWKYGKMSGKGILMNKKTGAVFDGIFENNQFDKGVINYANRDQYRGLFRNGDREDNQGRYIYRNRSHKGSVHSRSQNSRTSQMSSDSSTDSKGMKRPRNSNSPKRSRKYEKQYVGGWRNGEKHGKCVINYQNGDCSKYVYDRNHVPATMECTYQWADGSEFNGWLKRDNFQNFSYDRGTYKKASGQIVEV